MKSAQVFVLVIFSVLVSFGATLRVPQDFPTIQAAVAASVAGDSIVISPGSYAIPAAPCTLANGAQHTCGLVLHDGTALAGSGPSQTVLDFSGADIGILLQFATATVKLAHLQNAGTALFAYVGSNITSTNLIITNSNAGMELNQGNSYTIINTTIDGIHDPSQTGSGVDVPFGGAANIQNNLVTHSDRAFTAGSFPFGTYAFNDAFGSLSFDWGECTAAGCAPVSAPATNISADPLYCPDFSLQTASPARNAGNPAIFNPDGTRSDLGAYGGPEAILPPTCGGPVPPTGLRATVGNQMAHLFWNPSSQQVDSYNVRRDDGTIVTVIQVLSVKSSMLDPGLTNDRLYTYTVAAVKNGIESSESNKVYVRPNEFAVGQAPSHAANPILFLHGICLDPKLFPTNARTWDETKAFLVGTAQWTFGGTLTYLAGDDPRIMFPIADSFVSGADLYTSTFGDCQANYSVGRAGLLHQADEVQGFLRKIQSGGFKQRVSLVAHSMGGIAGRSYIADAPIDSVNRVSQFITYSSPHWGAPLAGIFGIKSQGAKDLAFDCDEKQQRLSYALNPFLDHLRSIVLPDPIRYFIIRGNSQQNWTIPSTPYQVYTKCLSNIWDGVIPIDSADFGSIPSSAPTGQTAITSKPVQLLTTGWSHDNETSDSSAILCALDLRCFIVSARSPVDIELLAPDGRSMTRNLAEIPGASLMELEEADGHIGTTIVVPFPQAGEYAIKVTPKLGALPTDTYTLEVSRVGQTTVLAQDQQIQNIPPAPYVVPVLAPVGLDIKPGSFPNTINLKSSGKIPVAILSAPDFNAPALIDTGSLTFGHLGDEASLAFCSGAEDVNGDGLPDLVCHFNTQKARFLVGDTRGVLIGRTVEGVPFIGSDSIRIVP